MITPARDLGIILLGSHPESGHNTLIAEMVIARVVDVWIWKEGGGGSMQ